MQSDLLMILVSLFFIGFGAAKVIQIRQGYHKEKVTCLSYDTERKSYYRDGRRRTKTVYNVLGEYELYDGKKCNTHYSVEMRPTIGKTYNLYVPNGNVPGKAYTTSSYMGFFGFIILGCVIVILKIIPIII